MLFRRVEAQFGGNTYLPGGIQGLHSGGGIQSRTNCGGNGLSLGLNLEGIEI